MPQIWNDARQFFLDDEQVEILSEQERKLVENFRKLSSKKQSAVTIDRLISKDT